MEKRAIDYITDYIRERYPMYWPDIEKSNFYMTILDNLYKQYNTMNICDGMADLIIDKFVDDYAKNNLSNIRNKYNNLCLEVKKKIVLQNDFLSNDINADILDLVAKRIASVTINIKDENKFVSLDKSNYSKVLKGIDYFRGELYAAARNHINDVLLKNPLLKKCSVPMNQYLLDLVTSQMLGKKNIGNIIDGKYDSLILSMYEEIVDKVKHQIATYTMNVLSKHNYVNMVDTSKVVKYINDYIFVVGIFTVNDLLNGNADDLIIDYANGIKPLGSSAVRKYIYERIQQLDSLGFTKEQLKMFAEDMYPQLYEQHGEDILKIENDEVIARAFQKKCYAYFSIKNENSPEKVKHVTKKRSIGKQVKILFLVALAVSLTFAGSVAVFKTADNVSYDMAYAQVMDFDRFDYEFIYSIDNEMVQPTAENAVEFYNKVNSSLVDNINYAYLGFYNAYNCCGQDRLYIMDEILERAKRFANRNPQWYPVANELKENSCFLEFAMRRLDEMGCEEIKDQKYIDALETYKKVMENSDVIPMKTIEKNYEEQFKIIEEIMSMYRKYNKNLMKDFSKVLSTSEYDSGLDIIENTGSRRNI